MKKYDLVTTSFDNHLFARSEGSPFVPSMDKPDPQSSAWGAGSDGRQCPDLLILEQLVFQNDHALQGAFADETRLTPHMV